MVRLEVSIQTFQSGESKPGNGPSFERGMCKNYYGQQHIAKEFGDQLCSGATESSRSVTHLVDQSASHRADKECAWLGKGQSVLKNLSSLWNSLSTIGSA